MRLREGILLTWDEVDLQARYIRLAAWRNKGRRFFDLPMPDIVHDMLVARRAIGHKSEHVFPVYRPRKSDGRIGPLNNINHVLYRIGDATGIEVHPHALRRTFQSVAATVGLGAYEQKALVNHAFPRGDVTGGYVEFEDDDLAQAMQRVADRMKELCKIDELNAANVTKLRGANPV